VTGARHFLIAYNVNLLATKEQAHRIALDLREQGRGPQQPDGCARSRPSAGGVEEYGMAQVSMNLDDFKVTPPHVAFEEVGKEARALKLAVAGSEIVGLVPLQALLMAAEHYIDGRGVSSSWRRDRRSAWPRTAWAWAACRRVRAREAHHRIHGGGRRRHALASSSVRSFVRAVGARTSAPGGGSASALTAALGAALGTMVGWMTYGKRKFEDKDAVMRRLIPPAARAMEALIPLIDADTQAFAEYMEARNLPQETATSRPRGGARALEAGLQKAVEVPLSVLRVGDGCWDAMVDMARHGNVASRSDLEVGAKALEAGLWGAYRNVIINLPEITDETFRAAAGRRSGSPRAKGPAAPRGSPDHPRRTLTGPIVYSLSQRPSAAYLHRR
jgi:glutamate formiminotransferase/formiminotetrahydrofolate cyclodeaminase